ncbi:histidine kinase dimerization/phospho-acceptor domain-containing protein [Sphingomonas sp.]|uniref:sensor histidine kinase n=1 Tax=Sphingomonas sp. TaxID=28214 RepID=UPI001810E1CE|nr:histidine kinase dimerization/phospho-acceptor domain-containing protein [Sphingomonas sp.]MBA3510686.1 HAMP domain-containing histidine kinase [Sphingomonas sp.]
MRFDDRLMTVLDQPATDPHDRAVRWRQLVDLVARAGGQADNPLVEQALHLIRSDRPLVDDSLRAAAARAVAALPLPYELVALFASDTMAVSAPILAAARLERDDWQRLLTLADEETRRFILTLHPDLPLPQPAAERAPAGSYVEPPEEPHVEPAPEEPHVEPAEAPQVPSISDVVARIERLRRGRAQAAAGADEAAAAAAGAPTLFRWECGPSGEIIWVEGAPRGPLIGRSIGRAEEGEGVEQEVERAFAMRSPFRDARFSLPGEGTLAGEWKISGVPAFEPANGRFAGYRGIALREAGAALDPARYGQSGLLTDPNSLRELVHEIKTPLNAIIGFAEIIDAQLLGPADRRYRTRAAEIVAQARLLLSAIDDLDFAAKLQSDRNRPGSGTDLAMLLEQIGAGMRQGASSDAPQLELSIETRRRRCALEPALAERLITRFCTALLSAAADGKQVAVHLDNSNGRCLLWVRPPPGLDSSNGDPASGGFSLRLVRGLARIAGGNLTITKARITLALPEL